METKVYNIYIDESSIDNPKNHFMVIGGIFMKRSLRDEIKNKILDLRKKHNFYPELKWTKTNKKNASFIRDLIDVFFSYTDDDFQFHCIVVDKTLVAYDIFHSEDKELAFYKFAYQLLQNKFKNNSEYYMFLDYKENSNPDRIKDLSKFLGMVAAKKYTNTNIKHIQSYCSKDVQFIQLADFFTGAVGYIKNNLGNAEAKNGVLSYLLEKLGKNSLDFKSTKSEKKFNIFQINL